MSKVIQIRGVPDDVHRRLVEAADAEGQSLTVFLNQELTLIARRADLVWHNREVVLAGRANFGAAQLPPDEVVAAIDEGRREREEQLAAVHDRHRT